jgi:dTDP-4-amino-4,6-dideoxygalactose transaminase
MVEGYDTRVFGLNLRLPELSAAIAKVQTKRLPTMLSARRRNAELMSKTLAEASEKLKIRIKLPTENENKRFNLYLYTIAFEDNITRDKAKRKMLEKGIGATVYYDPPVHQTPYYSKMIELSHENNEKNNGKNLAKTEQSSRQVLSLPVHPLVKDRDIEDMANIIKEIN